MKASLFIEYQALLCLEPSHLFQIFLHKGLLPLKKDWRVRSLEGKTLLGEMSIFIALIRRLINEFFIAVWGEEDSNFFRQKNRHEHWELFCFLTNSSKFNLQRFSCQGVSNKNLFGFKSGNFDSVNT